ncbi:hypothetical protein ACIGZJ_30990 [Kitasatospora sp. NPDC052868]|uniref:hypothetical protein n=1 Tax=Kitasatospora sp. NPDC052868 TaxID=3364060 RepID=UPI0037C5FD0B
MADTVRSVDNDPRNPRIVVTTTVDIVFVLLEAHPVLPRIDTVVRHGDTVSVVNGVPAADPVAPRLPEALQVVASVWVPPMYRGAPYVLEPAGEPKRL